MKREAEVKDKLRYTVKEVSELTNVTIKALHHYHKIGLLAPSEVSEAGYRLYGMKELERLQHILFYRELDVPLGRIKEILETEPDRLAVLTEQRELLAQRGQRLERLIRTIDESIRTAEKGETMDRNDMFKGFADEAQWREAMSGQNEYVKETYGYDLLDDKTIDPVAMNETAAEAKRFMDGMAQALRDGARFDDERVLSMIGGHVRFLDRTVHATSPSDFAAQTRFFMNDDFHRSMLEGQQTGLAYYICFAAESFAARPT
jgi:DNA-binding transcriptional MerR regulator